MPKKAKVFVAEDDLDLAEVEKLRIELEGHEVVREASSLEEALRIVDQIAKKKRGGLIRKERVVNVAVIDGNLGTGPTDGPQIADALKKVIPGIKIVFFSGEPVSGGDVSLRKPDDISILGNIVTKL